MHESINVFFKNYIYVYVGIFSTRKLYPTHRRAKNKERQKNMASLEAKERVKML